MAIGKTLAKLREWRGLTMRQAAKHLCISPSYLNELEKGRAIKIKMDYLYAAADLYGVDPDFLCAEAKRVPRDVYYKILRCPELLHVIREH